LVFWIKYRNFKDFQYSTLVELIVVITILAILGTIAFISLQGYSADARNSKRTSDVASLAQKISIEIAKSRPASEFALT
jgi:prepilin-type N-terminal cleavage/methylation domain-containing protein